MQDYDEENVSNKQDSMLATDGHTERSDFDSTISVSSDSDDTGREQEGAGSLSASIGESSNDDTSGIPKGLNEQENIDSMAANGGANESDNDGISDIPKGLNEQENIDNMVANVGDIIDTHVEEDDTGNINDRKKPLDKFIDNIDSIIPLAKDVYDDDWHGLFGSAFDKVMGPLCELVSKLKATKKEESDIRKSDIRGAVIDLEHACKDYLNKRAGANGEAFVEKALSRLPSLAEQNKEEKLVGKTPDLKSKRGKIKNYSNELEKKYGKNILKKETKRNRRLDVALKIWENTYNVGGHRFGGNKRYHKVYLCHRILQYINELEMDSKLFEVKTIDDEYEQEGNNIGGGMSNVFKVRKVVVGSGFKTKFRKLEEAKKSAKHTYAEVRRKNIKNIVCYLLGKKLGNDKLFMKARLADFNGEKGLLMKQAEDTSFHNFLTKEAKDLSLNMTKGALADATAIGFLDYIFLQRDRHGANLFVQRNKNNVITGLTGIDNDECGYDALKATGTKEKDIQRQVATFENFLELYLTEGNRSNLPLPKQRKVFDNGMIFRQVLGDDTRKNRDWLFPDKFTINTVAPQSRAGTNQIKILKKTFYDNLIKFDHDTFFNNIKDSIEEKKCFDEAIPDERDEKNKLFEELDLINDRFVANIQYLKKMEKSIEFIDNRNENEVIDLTKNQKYWYGYPKKMLSIYIYEHLLMKGNTQNIFRRALKAFKENKSDQATREYEALNKLYNELYVFETKDCSKCFQPYWQRI